MGSNVKSESEKEGGVFGDCILCCCLKTVFKIEILNGLLCKRVEQRNIEIRTSGICTLDFKSDIK